jgi:hypothetical protein
MLFKNNTDADALQIPTSRARRRWARRAGVVAISASLLAAMPAATALADPAAASTAKASSAVAAETVNLQVLHAVVTEELADELYLQINGETVWTAQDSIEDGGTIAVNRKAKVGDTVTLIDADGPFDGDDVLGSDIVDSADGGILTFGNFDTDYWLEYGPA